MLAVITQNTITDPEAYLKAARRFVREARCDSGCLEMNLLYNTEDPTHVTFFSKWEKESDWQAHTMGETFHKHIPSMAPYYQGGTDSFYTVEE
ncbi:MAG: antibiotic biosynthesis monooxygenase family protein [Eubacteriales bacterium]|nr:antibiotic biosynthesis monooxygenase family protein [Eubacteriales bacterium]